MLKRRLMESCVISFLLLIPLLANATVIRVNSDHGNNSSSCLTSGSEPCKTLRYAITHLRSESNWVVLLETNVELSGVIRFESIANITLNSAFENISKVVQCSNQTALFFKNVNRINISNIKFSDCGALDKESKYKAALLFNASSDITISNTTANRSRLTAIAFLACYGNILLQNVNLLNSVYGKNCFSFPGGVSIEITDPNKPAHYTLRYCKIRNNRRVNLTKGCDKSSLRKTIIQSGKSLGGGIGVYFAGHCSNNSVNVSHTNVSGNCGKWGGGMHIQFNDSTQGNNVSVMMSNFIDNTADIAGGGLIVILKNCTNKVTFYEVEFAYNRAVKYGGGLAISSVRGNQRYTSGGNLMFKHCTLRGNSAMYSPAVDVSPYFSNKRPVQLQSGSLPIPLFSNVTVIGNYIKNTHEKPNKTMKIVTGVFSITQFTAHFTDYVNFTSNNFSALLLSSATAVFGKGTVSSFYNNSGGNGGAIAMYGYSFIVMSDNTLFEFFNNSASQYGGGIFYQTSDQHTFITGLETTCFLHREDLNVRNITLTFQGNRAGSGGSSIYADSFYGCYSYCHEKLKLPFNETIMGCIGNVTLDNSNQSRLQSLGYRFFFNDSFIGKINVIPGAKRTIPFSIKDEFNQTVNPLMNVGLATKFSKSSIKFLPEYTLTGEITPCGHPKDTAIVHFITEGIGGIYFHFNLTLLDCPPGFYFDKDPEKLKCVCSADQTLYDAVIDCNYTSYMAHMRSDYWAGYIPENETSYKHLYFSPCFQPLCNRSLLLPNSPAELESNVCYENRTGVMCGGCIENHSVYYHSPDFACKENHLCHLGPLLYLVSEILPVCVLFAIIVIFDFSFTSGGTVGFIFFSQYLDKLTVHINDTVYYLRKPYRLFYGIFNFEYFTADYLSFCLWKDFQILDVIFFKYITILAAFALVVILISLLKSNRCGWLLKWRTKVTTKTSFVRGLSAFLVICYSQCTYTSFLILKSTNPSGINGTTIHRYSYYGGLPYFEGRHLIYAIPAIISLVFVTILPPLILLLHPLSLHLLSLCGLSEHWIVNKILQLIAMNKLMPFMDCFQSCYKDRLRFFAGLYFVYRVAILCTYTLFETYYSYRMSAEIILISFLGIHSVVKPYKNRLHNLIDSLIFFNLAVINALSIYTDFFLEEFDQRNSSRKKAPLVMLTVSQLVLLYLPMLVSMIYAVRKAYSFCKKRAGRRDYEMLEEVKHD